MPSGIERAPVHTIEAGLPQTAAAQNSLSTFVRLLIHDRWVKQYLELDSETPFRLDGEALEARRQHQQSGREMYYHDSRGISHLGKLAMSTVEQIETEFASQTVLDIGCGTGRLGTELRRGQAKAKVTFLDNDEQQIEKLKLKSGCKKVVAEATNLPFEYESFAKTLSVFSAIHWAETPYERIQSLNEALRVTEVGGSLFVIPAFSSLHHRQRLNPKIEQLTHRVKGKEMTVSKLALKTWALQDYVMLHSLLAFAKQSYCSITWCGTPKPSLRQVDNYSAIIDKHRSIPPEVFAGNLAVAERFMANTTN